MKIAAGIEYVGTSYCGWQRQENSVPSIQAEVEKAFSAVADQPINVICAGRTDRGVHATGQVIHFETIAGRSEYAWLCGANANLPHDIVVTWVKQVDDDFHARFSAQARCYQYLIYNSSVRTAIGKHRVAWHFAKLNLEAMQEAAQHLVGTHDFTSFRAVSCQAKSPVRTIYFISLRQQNELITLNIKANAFLHHMVRNIVGVLLKVGERKASTDWPLELLEAKDRTQAAMTASPHGLYLTEVEYPKQFAIPQPRQANFCI